MSFFTSNEENATTETQRHREEKEMSRENYMFSRRQVVRSLADGSILMPGILQQLLADEAGTSANPVGARAPHYLPRAKRVIFMYMSGGVSHMDSFDPKPRLFAEGGSTRIKAGNGRPYLRPLWEVKPGGTCGSEGRDLFSNVREGVDDICLIRSMRGDHDDHFQGTL